MTSLHQIQYWLSATRIRRLIILLLLAFPAVVVIAFISLRFLNISIASSIIAVACCIVVMFARSKIKLLDELWLIRKLDQHIPQLEDSSDLVFKQTEHLSPLQTLQQQRIDERISQLKHIDFRDTWPWRNIFLAWVISAVISALFIFWPEAKQSFQQIIAGQTQGSSTASIPFRLVDGNISIRAPSYTGLATRTETSLSSTFPEAANLQWSIRLEPQPQRVDLVFHDGQQLAMQSKNGNWQADRRLMQSSLYRIYADGKALPDNKPYRLQMIKDKAPAIRVALPDRSLSIIKPGQKSWPLNFEAEDDYGLGAAQVTIRLAQGTGENISFKEQSFLLAGQGNRKQKRYTRDLDLAALGLAAGSDVIVQFSVSDQHPPQANITRSSSFILRWPPEQMTEASGAEGMLKKVMPAYFRSQRQIIIDTEKLLAERKNYSAEQFTIRSDEIGVDQRILRLRYGQFLGEESEDAAVLPTNDAHHSEDKDEQHGEHEHDDKKRDAEHAEDDHHQHEHGNKKQDLVPTESDKALLEEFGHTHDIPEAATLLEPATKALLRSALNEMWQAELYLRQGEPKRALPYENRALGFIKKVQQADRIYLARVGSELPPIDETRRLSGDRAGLNDRTDFLTASEQQDQALTAFWQSLAPLETLAETKNNVRNFSALRAWLRDNPNRTPDALSVYAALDTFERQPNCTPCLVELKKQLWPLLNKPPANPLLRTAPDRNGQRYLDALQKAREP